MSADAPKKKPNGKPFARGADPRRNMNGRPLKHKEFTEKLQVELEPLALERLYEQLNHRKPEIVQGAIKEVLNRSRGKAPQPLTGEGGEGPVQTASADADLMRQLLAIEQKQKEAAAKALAATTAHAVTPEAPAKPE